MMTKYEESQKALKEVVAVLDAIKGGTDRDRIYYEIGRALMIAKLAVRVDTQKVSR